MAVRKLVVIGLTLAALAVLIPGVCFPVMMHRKVRANDDATLECLRVLRDLEKAFAAANGGRFAPPECLFHPYRCGAKSPAAASAPSCPVLSAAGKVDDDRGLGPQFHEFLNARGFTYQYRSGEGPTALSRTFVVAAEPVARGMTGTLAFGLDETGRICVVAAAQNPRSGRLLEGGRLRPDCDSTE